MLFADSETGRRFVFRFARPQPCQANENALATNSESLGRYSRPTVISARLLCRTAQSSQMGFKRDRPPREEINRPAWRHSRSPRGHNVLI